MDMNLRLDWCSYKAAKYAVMNWHYSKTLAVSKMVKIGVWENDGFVGVILFNYGANPNLYKPYRLKQIECVELTRIALKKHYTPVSKLLKIAIIMIRKQSPKLKLLISFADSNQGHLGKIYQAGNWIYTGIAKTTPQYMVNGKWIHQRQFGSLGYSVKENIFPTRKLLNKFRYLYPLVKKMRKQIELLSKPYPKKLCDAVVKVA